MLILFVFVSAAICRIGSVFPIFSFVGFPHVSHLGVWGSAVFVTRFQSFVYKYSSFFSLRHWTL